MVVWWDSRNPGTDIYAQLVGADGIPAWALDGTAVTTEAGYQQYPAIVSDGAGGAIITWEHMGVQPKVYAQRINNFGDPVWPTGGVALCTAAGEQRYPAIVSDGSGGAIVTWTDSRSGAIDVYAQRVDGEGVLQWSESGVALTSTPPYIGRWEQTSVSDGAGGAIVSWRDQRSGNSDIYAQRVDSSGSNRWATNGIALCTVPSDELGVTSISDGAGGAIVAWFDHRSGSADIYAQRVNRLGVPQWIGDGVALCVAANDQHHPRIVSDGGEGAIAAWFDHRGGSAEIYAQRVNTAGATQWTANGNLLADVTSTWFSFAITEDGTGGAVVSWEDTVSVDSDIFAQRVNASGVRQWPDTGVAVCTSVGDQGGSGIASDGAGGAIISWHDTRNGATDIYSQRIMATGNTPSAPMLTAVVDVPNDDGGFVRVRWSEGLNATPLSYEVYRDDFGSWTLVQTVPDNGSSTYSLVVPTIADSSCNTPFGHNFRVRAVGPPNELSNVGFGRSVDNRAPTAPVLAGSRTMTPSQVDVTLNWNRTAPDIASWVVYLNESYFADVYDTLLVTSFGPPFGDQRWTVRGLDYHCNVGAWSNEIFMPEVNTFPGVGVAVTPHDQTTGLTPVTVTFAEVTATGATWVETTASGPPTPAGFQIGDGHYYQISTTAIVTTGVEVCITYDEQALTVDEQALRMLHFDENATPPQWVDITISLNTDFNVICGKTDHLSPFVIGTSVPTGVGDPRTPIEFALHANIPNPFNPITTIAFDVPQGGADVSISIYDVSGRLVRNLIDEHRAAGRWSVEWNGDDNRGARVASGVYFYRMRAGEFVDTRKMVLLK